MFILLLGFILSSAYFRTCLHNILKLNIVSTHIEPFDLTVYNCRRVKIYYSTSPVLGLKEVEPDEVFC